MWDKCRGVSAIHLGFLGIGLVGGLEYSEISGGLYVLEYSGNDEILVVFM